MGAIAYARASDNIAGANGNGTVTASAEDVNYPVTQLCNLDPAYPAKLTTVTGWWMIEYPAPVAVRAAGFVNHNLNASLANVKIQGNTTSDFSSPAFSATFTIPQDEEDGFSLGPWLDFGETKTYQYWRLYFGSANSLPIGIGELILVSALRALPNDPAPGFQPGEEVPDIVHSSSFGGTTRYFIGAKWKTWTGTIPATTDADHWSLSRSARGRARPWFFVPDEDVNACYLVVFDWSSPRMYATNLDRVNRTIEFAVRELSRGVPL